MQVQAVRRGNGAGAQRLQGVRGRDMLSFVILRDRYDLTAQRRCHSG